MKNSGRFLNLSLDAPFTYRFDDFELDPARFELRNRGVAVHLEPQVLSLLILLVSNSERLVGKDELIEKIWDGRFISEAAVAARIKSARRALGDDGKSQRLIRTIHGKGFRFIAEVTFHQQFDERLSGSRTPQAVASRPSTPQADKEQRPSIAVLPFRLLSSQGPLSFVADALADELITDLSRQRWLLVIARGSSFRFRNSTLDCREIGEILNVRYCLSGSVEESRGAISISVELARTSDSVVIWADRFKASAGEIIDVQQEIVTAIVANLEVRIPQHEALIARAAGPAALDSWSAYHLGIDHMFRFNRSDNMRAAQLFEQSLSFEPEFARSLGGLSFTRFQDAFLQYSADPNFQAEQARSLAERALQCDPLDPFAHLNLGRSLWLRGEIRGSIDLLRNSIALSPNYAQAIYSKAWAEMTQGDPQSSDEGATLALRLSPLDPLRYAMLGVRSINALIRGDYEHAAELGERAARSPGAHKHIAVIAALGNHLAGNRDQAFGWVNRAKQIDPDLSKVGFLRSFPFALSPARELIETTLVELRL